MGHWALTVDSRDCSPDDDVEDVVKALLGRFPSSGEFWASRTSKYQVDLFCGLLLGSILTQRAAG